MKDNQATTTQDIKEIFSAKIVSFDLQNWNGHIVMLNAEQAAQYWIKDDDKISLIRRNEEFVVDVSLTERYCFGKFCKKQSPFYAGN